MLKTCIGTIVLYITLNYKKYILRMYQLYYNSSTKIISLIRGGKLCLCWVWNFCNVSPPPPRPGSRGDKKGYNTGARLANALIQKM